MKGRIHHHHASSISYMYIFVKCISRVLMLYIHLDSTNSFYLELFISIIFDLCYNLLYYPMTYMILVSYRFDLNFSLINIWRVLFLKCNLYCIYTCLRTKGYAANEFISALTYNDCNYIYVPWNVNENHTQEKYFAIDMMINHNTTNW